MYMHPEFRGFDSSGFLSSRGGIPRAMGGNLRRLSRDS